MSKYIISYMHATSLLTSSAQQHTIVIIGGLSGRLDQTVHTLSLLHKLRRSRKHIFVVTDENVAWLLDTVSTYMSFGEDYGQVFSIARLLQCAASIGHIERVLCDGQTLIDGSKQLPGLVLFSSTAVRE